MASGGMIQTQRRDGSWKDAFPCGYKSHTATMNVSKKTKRPARLVSPKGVVLFEHDDQQAQKKEQG